MGVRTRGQRETATHRIPAVGRSGRLRRCRHLVLGRGSQRRLPSAVAEGVVGAKSTVRVLRPQPVTRSADVRATGNVKVRNYVSLAPQLTGRVTWLAPGLRAGGRFKAGEPLLRIDRANFDLALQQAQAELASAEANLLLQRAEVRRRACQLAAHVRRQAGATAGCQGTAAGPAQCPDRGRESACRGRRTRPCAHHVQRAVCRQRDTLHRRGGATAGQRAGVRRGLRRRRHRSECAHCSAGPGTTGAGTRARGDGDRRRPQRAGARRACGRRTRREYALRARVPDLPRRRTVRTRHLCRSSAARARARWRVRVAGGGATDRRRGMAGT